MDLKTHIGLKVKSARQEKGLTQEQLAEQIGRAVETVSNIERGFALTGLDTLQQISGAVGKPVAFFLDGFEDACLSSRKRISEEEQLRRTAARLSDAELQLANALLIALAKHGAKSED